MWRFHYSFDFRVVNLTVESRRSPSRVFETPKPGTPWNRGPCDLQYAQPRGFYHSVTVPSASPHSASNVWPSRQPTFGDFMSLNSLSAIPPQWHQDPAAMAWIASRHMMLPMTGHPHNYTTPLGHHAHNSTTNGAMQPLLYSPTSSSSTNPVATEDTVFPCELCGKSFNAKETLRQVLEGILFIILFCLIILVSLSLFFSTCWLTLSRGHSFVNFAMLDLPLITSLNHIWCCIGLLHLDVAFGNFQWSYVADVNVKCENVSHPVKCVHYIFDSLTLFVNHERYCK